MNVANLITSLGNSATGTTGGVTSPQESGVLGQLFALQMGAVLQGAQQNDLLQLLPQELSGEETSELADLLALIQQMLTSTSPTNLEQLAPQVEDKLSSIELLGAKLQQNGAARLLTDETQRLITTFSQQGLPQEQAAKVVELLASLAKSDETGTQADVQQVSKQAQQILASLGVDAKGADKALTTEKKGSSSAIASKTALRSDYSFTAPGLNEAAKVTELLRVNLALSRYQAEAASGGALSRNVELAVPSTQSVQATGQLETDVATLPTPSTTTLSNSVQTLGGIQPQTVSSYTVHGDQFTQEVSELFVKQMKVGSLNGISEAKLILYPQSLGQVDVKITAQNGVITAHFSAETASGKEMLDNQLPQLRAALTQQGLQVDRLEVNQQPSEQFNFQQQREQARQQSGNRQQQQNSKEEQPEFSLEALIDSAAWSRQKAAVGNEYTVYA